MHRKLSNHKLKTFESYEIPIKRSLCIQEASATLHDFGGGVRCVFKHDFLRAQETEGVVQQHLHSAVTVFFVYVKRDIRVVFSV